MILEWLTGTAAALLQILLGFYGFWLIWRVLLPWLPGPSDPEKRIAPYAYYFTDPLVKPVTDTLHVPDRLIAAALLVLVALTSAGITQI